MHVSFACKLFEQNVDISYAAAQKHSSKNTDTHL